MEILKNILSFFRTKPPVKEEVPTHQSKSAHRPPSARQKKQRAPKRRVKMRSNQERYGASLISVESNAQRPERDPWWF